jgi:hypothetical protein
MASSLRVSALAERHIDALHDDVMDFAALFEGGFAQGVMSGAGLMDYNKKQRH